MDITGTYTANDLRSATWVHLRPRRSLAVLGIIVIVLAMFATYAAFFGAYSESSGWAKWALVGALAYLTLAFGVGIPYKCHRAFRQRKDLQRPCSFSTNDVGLFFSTEGMSGTKPWTDYLKWKEGRNTFLLYMSDNLYQLIPKRFFESESDLNAFRELIKQKVQGHEA